MKKAKQYKDMISWLFIMLLIFQVFLMTNISDLSEKFEADFELAKDIEIATKEALIEETIRPQMRLMLAGIRQSWINYLQIHPEVELLLKDSEGRYIYQNENNKMIHYDNSTMFRKVRADNWYDIYDRTTLNLICEKVRPQWNRETIIDIFNIIAVPTKSFGPTSSVLIYDAYNGEILIDNSRIYTSSNNNSPNNTTYMSYLYLSPNNKNPEATKKIIEDEILQRYDSIRGTNIISFFYEPMNMGNEASNFEKYPLGQYNREFQEKIILPYESVSLDNEAMQIAILLSAKESEIIQGYDNILKQNIDLQNSLQETIRIGILTPILSVAISLITIFLAMFGLNTYAHFFYKHTKHLTKEGE